MKHNSTTNAGKNPVDRIDLWATGYFDFLLGRNYGDRFHRSVKRRIDNAKKHFKKFKKGIDPHYPDDRK